MDAAIRACASEDEVRQTVAPIWHYFGRSPPDEDQNERSIRALPAERVYGAWEGAQAAGGLAAFPLQLTAPGGTVPTAGVIVAGILPTHRRQGVLRAMMRTLLDACRQAGEPAAYLWASEDTIYGRFGFGLT
jgi:predicted acetyltransferase